MRKYMHFFFPFLGLLLFFTPLYAQTASTNALNASYAFENALFEDLCTNAELDHLYQTAKIALYSLEPEEQREYFLARVNFLRALLCGRDFMKAHDTQTLAISDPKKRPKFAIPDSVRIEAEVYIDRAIEHNERSLAIRPSADGYVGKSVLTLSSGMLAGPLPLFFAFFTFLDAGKAAIKTDPNHLESALLAASMLAFPGPPFGNQKQAIIDLTALYQKMTPQTPRMDYFICLTGLAQAYSALQQKQNALFWLQKAQAVYPTNKSLLPFERRIKELPD